MKLTSVISCVGLVLISGCAQHNPNPQTTLKTKHTVSNFERDESDQSVSFRPPRRLYDTVIWPEPRPTKEKLFGTVIRPPFEPKGKLFDSVVRPPFAPKGRVFQ